MSRNHLRNKIFLICTKYIPHFIAFLYAIYTLFNFVGIDLWGINYIANVSIITWIYLFINSIVYKYCYVHRLPLYYIALNDAISVIDYYYRFPISAFKLLIIHIIIIVIFLFGYSYYYIKYKK